MYDDDKSGSASAWTGENGLDAAFVFHAVAVTWRGPALPNHAMLAAPADQGRRRRKKKLLVALENAAILLELVLGLFVFGRVGNAVARRARPGARRRLPALLARDRPAVKIRVQSPATTPLKLQDQDPASRAVSSKPEQRRTRALADAT